MAGYRSALRRIIHVQPGDPASEHVRLIQEALRQVDGTDVAAAEAHYGEKTTKAIIALDEAPDLHLRHPDH